MSDETALLIPVIVLGVTNGAKDTIIARSGHRLSVKAEQRAMDSQKKKQRWAPLLARSGA
tara:strand:+ start:68636 stop:68815 length:180 start_codon:yes stop_codon:yes gene_type:complete